MAQKKVCLTTGFLFFYYLCFMEKKYYAQSELIQELGLTKSQFDKLNIEASKITKNPHYSKLPMYLYDISLKEEIMSRVDYIEMMDGNNIRNEKKREELMAIEKNIQSFLQSRWTANDSKYIIHVGDTNSGKTHNAVQHLKKAKNGVYLCPLRLLAWEIYEKLNAEGTQCNLLTGEEEILVDGATITASTIEMFDSSKHYDVVIIDECFMIGDKERGKSWTKALLEGNVNTKYVISNNECLDLIKKILDIKGSKYDIIEHKKLVPLSVEEDIISEKQPPKNSLLVCFSRLNVLMNKKIYSDRGYKCSVIYGNLPPAVKKQQIQIFLDGLTDVVITTDVVGMGLNLPCDNVIFLELEKFDGEKMRELYPFEIKQIGGRAGRYKMSKKGTVGAIRAHHTQKIKEAMFSLQEVKNGYSGVDSEILKLLPQKSLSAKLRILSKINYIPEKFQSVLQTEKLDRYIELAKYEDVSKLDVDLSWKLITLPVKKQNQSYWQKCVDRILTQDKIYAPKLPKYSPSNIDELETFEQATSEMDLFMYIYNSKLLSQHISKSDLEKIDTIKATTEVVIEKINDFLINKKMQSLKKCAGCGDYMKWGTKHDLCRECYNSSIPEEFYGYEKRETNKKYKKTKK